MADDRKDLPSVTAPNFLEKLREAVQTYMGTRGNVLNRGLTVRDMVDSGMATLSSRWAANGSGSPLVPVRPPMDPALTPYVIDLTPPPTPTGFAASAAISNIFVECDSQTYTQGHGHAKSILYGASWVSGPLPVFANAVALTEFQGTVFAYATNPATTWRLWLKWESVDGVKSVVPAGGTNGVLVITGQDVALLLDALAGKITTSELYGTLNDRIDLIDGPATLPNSLAQNASFLRSYANLNSKIFTQASAPTQRGLDPQTSAVITLQIGDIWIDTTLIGGVAGNRQMRWNGSAWVYSPDLAIATVDARVSNVETTKIGYATKGGIVFDNAGTITTADHVAAWNIAHPSDLAVWHTGLPLASAVKQVAITTVDPTTGLAITGIIEDRMTAVATTASKLYLEKSVRIGSGGSVVGYGLSGHVSAGEPVVTDSMFIANVDTFAVTIPISSVPTWAAYTAYTAGALVKANADGTSYPLQYLQCVQPGTSGSSGAGLWGYAYGVQRTDGTVVWQTVSRVPFSVSKATTTVDGVSIPTGTFMDGAYIREETVTSSKIHDLQADKITAGDVTVALNLTAGNTVTGSIKSSNTGVYGGVSQPTWKINGDGTATFNSVTVRGTVYAASGQIGGNTITSAAVSSPSYSAGSSGWTLKSDGHVEFGAADIRGQLTASQIDTRSLTVKDAGGTVIFGSGTALDWANIVPASSWLNSNVTYASLTDAKPPTNADHTASNTAAGIAGQGALATTDYVFVGSTVRFGDGSMMNTGDFVNKLSKIGTGNISTFIDGLAITNAYIGNAAIKNANIDDLAVNTIKIHDNSISYVGYGAGASLSVAVHGPSSLYINAKATIETDNNAGMRLLVDGQEIDYSIVGGGGLNAFSLMCSSVYRPSGPGAVAISIVPFGIYSQFVYPTISVIEVMK